MSNAAPTPKVDALAEANAHFGLFVCSVEGHLVERYGASVRHYIGAKRTVAKGAETWRGIPIDSTSGAPLATLAWDTKRVTPLTIREYRAYKREYDKAIAVGALKKVDAQAWLDFLAAEDSSERSRVAQLEAEAKKAALAAEES